MNGWKETRAACLPVILQRDFISSLDSCAVAECAIVVYFLFSEAFLSREATARGTPREKSTRCRSYKVISSSFTRLHSVPFHPSNSSFSLSPFSLLSICQQLFDGPWHRCN